MNEALFIDGVSALGGTLTETQISQFAAYSARLKEWNQKMNLTAITDDDGISVKHFLDSILPLYHLDIPEGSMVADIGTGAGFPGIPLKILRPDLKVTLVDSRYISSELLDQFLEFRGQDVLLLYGTQILNNSSSLK